MQNPTITVTKHDTWTHNGVLYSRTEYLLAGGDVTADWAQHARVAPFCHVTESRTSAATSWELQDRTIGGGRYLSSFGGEVWPSAYPALFDDLKLRGAPATRLTLDAERLFDAALATFLRTAAVVQFTC